MKTGSNSDALFRHRNGREKLPRRRFALIALLALVLALVASACGGDDDEGGTSGGSTDTSEGSEGEVTKGGIYRSTVVVRLHQWLRSDR